MKQIPKLLFKIFKSVVLDPFKRYFAVCFCSLHRGILEILMFFFMFLLLGESISDGVAFVFVYLIGKVYAIDECVDFFSGCKKNKLK